MRARLESMHRIAGLHALPQLITLRCAALVERGARSPDCAGLSQALQRRFGGRGNSGPAADALVEIALSPRQFTAIASSLHGLLLAVENRRTTAGSPPAAYPHLDVSSVLRVYYRDAGVSAGAALAQPAAHSAAQPLGAGVRAERRLWQSCERDVSLAPVVCDW